MPNVNEIIKITVDRQTAAVPQAGFGNVLFLGIPKAAADNPEAPFTGFANDADGNAVDVMEFTQAEQSGGIITSSSIPGKALAALFGQVVKPEKAYVGFKKATGEADAGVSLDRILQANPNFYCVIPVFEVDTADPTKNAQATFESEAGDATKDAQKIADWVASNDKIAFFQTSETAAYGSGSTDIASELSAQKRSRSAAFYGQSDEYIAAAAAGRVLPAPPGSIIWGYKGLSGITAERLSPTQFGRLDTKNYNYQKAFGGQNVLFEGRMADRGFIDIIRDTDWLVSRIREAMIFQLVNVDKIPYNQDGVDIILNSLTSVLEQAVLNGVLNDGYTVSSASLSDVPATDRAARKLPIISINATYSGAVQSVEFRLSLTV